MLQKSSLLIPFFFVSFNIEAQNTEIDFSFEKEPNTQDEVSFNFNDVLKEEKGFPLRGKISFDLGYQFGSPKRWVTVGPFSQLIFDQQHSSGQYYTELTIRNNYAYQIENDSLSIKKRYELDALIREAYWKKAFGDISLTLGKAIVTWGKADLSTVIDIVSPIDNTGSFFAKPEEVKTGQNIIKLDWYQGKNEFNFIYTPFAANNIQIEKNHPYDLLPSFITPTNNISDNADEWAFRWNQTQDKWELSVVAGDVHQRDPVFFSMEQTWQKNKVLGFGFNYSLDPFLWKFEALYTKDRPYQKIPPPETATGSKRKNAIKAVIGFDYANQNLGNWTFELSKERPIKKDAGVQLGEGSETTALFWSDRFLNDDLSANVAFMYIGSSIRNNLIRTGIDYKIHDDWTLNSQISIFSSTDSNATLKALSNFDRIDISLNYNFDFAN